ncbi:L-histidine N(alpha)-methyltransferase [Anabaenopsis sp. FSS-46]|uniref:L-histidine N(alpha)-methyltransferase n=1 Tax=Anabaenopsis sp. FSS-46 TaxID=2971766 RepID=UPI002473A70D|nr:L-histidine N(alpha)-methyltransferase [Anabaenopsis sp. FSS-46]MDH6100808.1 L-histidine N(alpha)-methyltransferase [Anabaenopsis sp. FSS-46]
MSTSSQRVFENVYVHSSQFPNQVYQDYLNGFFLKKINHKFHYDSVKQSQKWLKIHESYSPARTSDDCVNAYAKCFQKTADFIDINSHIQLIGLGCGSGEKDKLLVSYLEHKERAIIYYPVDVSLSLSVISAQKVRESYPQVSVQPVVCDLLHADDLIQELGEQGNGYTKIITFFGMTPNFTPDEFLPLLNNFLQSGDILLMSANLSPGDDYLGGVQQILPQYDNDLTKDWLITVLADAGINQEHGTIKFSIEDDVNYPSLKRVNARFEVDSDISFKLEGQVIEWHSGDKVQLFFSYRYTTAKMQAILQEYNIKVLDYWEGADQQEGVYFCQKI